MPVVLNERKQAEKIIESGDVGNKPTSTLFLLSKYYRQCCTLGKDETISKLDKFMVDNYKNYNPALWEEIIDDIAKNGIKYPIRQVSSVGITQLELDTIEQVDGLKFQKILFVILCHSKLYNIVSESNNDWANVTIPEIYKMARVTVKHRNDKFLFLNDLEKTGLISFSNKNDNLNLKCNFIDMNGEAILELDDFRELGYEYQNYVGKDKFIKCERCGRLVKKTNNKRIYCSDCAKQVKNEQNKLYYKNKF